MLKKLTLIARFYFSALFFFGLLVDGGLAWVVSHFGSEVVGMCMLIKAIIYPLYIYLWVVPLYKDKFVYYHNLGISRNRLLCGCIAIDYLICYLLLKLTALLFFNPIAE